LETNTILNPQKSIMSDSENNNQNKIREGIIFFLPIIIFSICICFINKKNEVLITPIYYLSIFLILASFTYLLLFHFWDNFNKRQKIGNKKNENSRSRTFLTIWIVTAGLIVVVLFGILVIYSGKEDAAQWAFTGVVPLLASWIGTVLAFYFGRENFETATKYMLSLSKETLDDIPVENMMISEKTMVYLKMNDSQTNEVWGNKKLKEIIDFFTKVRKDRIPILSDDGLLTPKYILHLHKLTEADNKEQTLFDFLNQHKEKFRFKTENGFITVKASTSLEKANKSRTNQSNCKDIFVTENGASNGKVIGWVTDILAVRFLTLKQQKSFAV